MKHYCDQDQQKEKLARFFNSHGVLTMLEAGNEAHTGLITYNQ
jgi:hypothetical protein